MTSGLLHTGRIWRITHNDDSVGGAVPTGTVVYQNVFARIYQEKPTMALLEQGLETPAMFSAILEKNESMLLQNNDQYEVTAPNISPYLNQRFVIVSDPVSSMLDSRRYYRVIMRRFVIAHTNTWQ